MPECEDCGDDLQDPRDKNAAGWWRDRCMDYIEAIAEDITPDERRTCAEILEDFDAR